MRNALPKKPKENECAILNLDDVTGNGTHWVAWYKKCKDKYYFDSFDFPPPTELINYLKSPIYYPTKQVQLRDQVFCGRLCLYVLYEFKTKTLQEIVNNLWK